MSDRYFCLMPKRQTLFSGAILVFGLLLSPGSLWACADELKDGAIAVQEVENRQALLFWPEHKILLDQVKKLFITEALVERMMRAIAKSGMSSKPAHAALLKLEANIVALLKKELEEDEKALAEDPETLVLYPQIDERGEVMFFHEDDLPALLDVSLASEIDLSGSPRHHVLSEKVQVSLRLALIVFASADPENIPGDLLAFFDHGLDNKVISERIEKVCLLVLEKLATAGSHDVFSLWDKALIELSEQNDAY